MGPVEPLPPEDPKAALAAFTVPGQADAINADIDKDVKESGVEDMTARYGARLVKKERCDYLRPTVILCDDPTRTIAKKEFMFPFVTVVKCAQDKMLDSIGPTLVCSAITLDARFQRALADANHIDRLNIGPIPTIQLNWLQPHEGSIVDFLFRARALQFDKDMIRI
jgi:acyl-CoA reductase-like NAD-dependent aldehyde dehydrogenase